MNPAATPIFALSRNGRRRTRACPRILGVLSVLAASLVACAPPEPVLPGPPGPSPRLPPVATVDGPLDLRVSYPRDSLALGTRGVNFIFGSAGSGEARVWVNGEEVEVQPNGGFLAFLPVPADSVYRVRGRLDGAEQTVEVPVRLPPGPPAPDSVGILEGSVYPRGDWVALPGERVPVGFTGTAGGRAWLELPGGDTVPLVPAAARGGATDFEVTATEPRADGVARYEGFLPARQLAAGDPRVPQPDLAAGVLPSAGDEGEAILVLALAPDTVRRPLGLNLLLADPDRPRVGVGMDTAPPSRNGDGRVIARPGPGSGPYHYVWANGTELELTGERGGSYRVRLAPGLSAWTPAATTRLLEPGTPPPESRVSVVRLDPARSYVDVVVGLDRRLPYAVEEDRGSLILSVFGAVSRVNFLQHGRRDPYVREARWRQPDDRTFQVDVELDGPVWGWEVLWGPGDDLVLRIRRPPTVAPNDPLRGLTVGVDPGHGGADTLTMGPTGLTEADANLGVALALRDGLESRGARVVMTRTANTGPSLVERTRLAREADVDVWISVHNNAFPDGVDPWDNNGTSVYYTHPRSGALARAVHRALLEELGLRDLGVGRADFHQTRYTWAPAILTESLFLMMPEHEAFLGTPEGRRRVARAHVAGLETWLRSLADR